MDTQLIHFNSRNDNTDRTFTSESSADMKVLVWKEVSYLHLETQFRNTVWTLLWTLLWTRWTRWFKAPAFPNKPFQVSLSTKVFPILGRWLGSGTDTHQQCQNCSNVACVSDLICHAVHLVILWHYSNQYKLTKPQRNCAKSFVQANIDLLNCDFSFWSILWH